MFGWYTSRAKSPRNSAGLVGRKVRTSGRVPLLKRPGRTYVLERGLPIMKITHRFIQQLRQGHVVPFVGSGVSLAVQANGKSVFPSWKDLLLGMADAVDDEDDAAIIRTHCKKRRWYKAAEEALNYTL